LTNIGALLAQQLIDRREAQMLLAQVLGVSRALVVAHPEQVLDATQEQLARSLIARRALGEPIAYLLGTREFYGRNFLVSPATLIPRPETELLVEQALARLSGDLSTVSPANASVSNIGATKRDCILDLGTGSGAIALSLALERPDAIVVAADVSNEALKIALKNAQHLKANVEFVESNWYTSLADRKFNLIISNPPYVAGNDAHLSQGDLRFEPQIALTDNSSDGLHSIRTIIDGATSHLNAGGWLLFEHGFDQADACRELLLKAGLENLISVKDLSGIARVAGGQIR
jgi:release factor glutamine methyltransferase